MQSAGMQMNSSSAFIQYTHEAYMNTQYDAIIII